MDLGFQGGFQAPILVIQKCLRETSGQELRDNYMFAMDLRVPVRKIRDWPEFCKLVSSEYINCKTTVNSYK